MKAALALSVLATIILVRRRRAQRAERVIEWWEEAVCG